MLAQMGVSAGPVTIQRAVDSLSKQSTQRIRDLGQTLLAAYAYDNFDVEIKTGQPTVEKPMDTLYHLTSGTLLPLHHGVTRNDLRCSKFLWEQSRLNDCASAQLQIPEYTYRHLLKLHPETKDTLHMFRRDRFNAWQFRHDLCTYGPEYFRQFRTTTILREPETVERIPLVKTDQVPAQAMNISNSTVSGNIGSIENLLHQGGVHSKADHKAAGDVDSDENMDEAFEDIGDCVVIFHGDLGTWERIQTAQLYRSIEKSPWRRLQHVVFIPGLFHLKMACADAIWQILIEPKAGRDDQTSLMHHAAILRLRETGKIGAGPGFRIMHELVQYDGVAERLECWRTEVHKTHPTISSLAEFAAAKPTWEQIVSLSNTLALDYVDREIIWMERKTKKRVDRDQQRENALIRNKYLLLYEELIWAMNAGDIGHVETSLVTWIGVFKGIGKHKYAKQMTKFLTDVHFVYPEALWYEPVLIT